MKYSKAEIDIIVDDVCNSITNGRSLKSILEDDGMPSRPTFYTWIKGYEDVFNIYARATKARADLLFDEIIEIADSQENDVIIVDGEKITNHNAIQRNRLQVDARKWAASKMNPKKYGDKLDIESGGKPITPQPTTVTFINARKKKDKDD